MIVTPLVDYARLLDVLDTEGERLATSATGTDPDLEVVHLPGMRLGEVVRHVGSVYRMVVSWVRDGERPTRWQREPAHDQTVVDYLRAGLLEVVDELDRHDSLDDAPTWWPEHRNFGFWCRRLAHETTIHRVDVQLTGAQFLVGDIAPEVALDGIDELMSLWFTHRLGILGIAEVVSGKVAINAGGRRWIARVSAAGTEAWEADEDEPVDATISSDAAGMYLWLWGRRPGAHVRESGDPALVTQLRSLLRVATR
ncbi:MAG: maleylpyruvate isomerase N-terminal domain-containing protein [Actinophytocola sp.]|uniref:maleylpyruvate isomerase N-terminal domain-containing protein n=1 Tax=Actinophytocola sp. TaxID=1872138 RepID=UPI003C763583